LGGIGDEGGSQCYDVGVKKKGFFIYLFGKQSNTEKKQDKKRLFHEGLLIGLSFRDRLL